MTTGHWLESISQRKFFKIFIKVMDTPEFKILKAEHEALKVKFDNM